MRLERYTQFAISSLMHPIRAVECAWSHATKQEKKRKLELQDGTPMSVILPEGISRTAYMEIPWEPDVVAFMERVIKDGMVVYDIGAHIGYDTLKASVRVGSAGVVVAFEPAKCTLAILNENCKAHPNIIVEAKAIGNGDCTSIMFKDFGFAASAFNTTSVPRSNGNFLEKKLAQPDVYPVESVSLDQYHAAHPDLTPNVIKLDVENGEKEVLDGATLTLREIRPVIIMEGGDEGRTVINNTTACLNILAEYDYTFFVYDGLYCTIVPHETQEPYAESINILCMPREKTNVPVFPRSAYLSSAELLVSKKV